MALFIVQYNGVLKFSRVKKYEESFDFTKIFLVSIEMFLALKRYNADHIFVLTVMTSPA